MADIQVGTANTIWQRGWFKIALIYKFRKGCVWGWNIDSLNVLCDLV